MSSDSSEGEELLFGANSGEQKIEESPDLGSPAMHPDQGDRLGFLHWSSVILDITSIARQYLLQIIIFFVLGRALSFGKYVVWIMVASVITSSVYHIYRYLTLRYRVTDRKLIIEQGWIFKTIRTIPIEKIQNLDLVQKVLHRIFKVAEVRIETAGGTGVEAVLRVISLKQVEELRRWIFLDKTVPGTPKTATENGLTSLAPEDSKDGPLKVGQVDGNSELLGQPPSLELAEDNSHSGSAAKTAATQEKTEILRIPTFQLIKAGIASNQGFVLLGIIASAIYQFGSEQYDQFISKEWLERIRWIQRLEWEDATTIQGVGFFLAAVAAFFLITRIFGAVWYVLRFSGYRLTRIGDDFQISFGLLTRISATVPRHRIQFVSVHRPVFFRLFKFSVIRIETAGGSEEKERNSGGGIVRECFVPVIPDENVDAVLEQIRNGLLFPPLQMPSDPPSIETNLSDSKEPWVGLSPLATRRKLRRTTAFGLLCFLSSCFASFTLESYWVFAPVVLLWPVLMYWAYRSSKSVKYKRTALGLVYRSGIFNKKKSIAFCDRIQSASISQTPFDRRWNMATLSVDTAGSGPAKHSIEIPYLDQEVARKELEAIRPYFSEAIFPIANSSTLPFSPAKKKSIKPTN